MAHLNETMKTRQPVELRFVECHTAGGQQQVVSVTASPLLDVKDRFSGAVMVVRDETRLVSLERRLQERQKIDNIVGRSEGIEKVRAMIRDLADVQTTVLITGDSGTGKELVVDALHYSGERRDGPLVKVNCAALSENLLESELFGHVAGAFTGAVKDKIGRFQRADGGTIFLDEIGEISQRMQLRLLRVIENMEFERVGESTPIKVDVRLVAATNRDLQETGCRRRVPRGSLLPSESGPDPRAVAAGAPGRHPPAGGALPAQFQPQIRPGDQGHLLGSRADVSQLPLARQRARAGKSAGARLRALPPERDHRRKPALRLPPAIANPTPCPPT